jgi:microcystin-dependent protein
MPINFPNSPSNGDIFGNFTYDTSIPGWRKTPENSASLPAGTIVQWPGATAPANWLICNGAAVSRTTYASLFAAIGVQYGSGDGSTTFNLPDLRGRVVAGLDSTQSEFNFLGEIGGAKTHTLTTSEIPAHSHTFSGTTSTDGNHTHPYYWTNSSGVASGSNPNYLTNVNSSGNSTGAAGAHSHTYSGTTSSVGSGGAHNNLQPYIVLNYIIKTSAGVTSGDSELATRVGAVENTNNLTPMGPNYIINGAFDVWQRGTSLSQAGGGVGADMWREYTDSGSGTQTKDIVDYPAGLPAQSYKFTASANSTNWVIWQIMESSHCAPLIGQTVTFSVYLKSSVARTFRLSLGVNTNTDAAWSNGSWVTSSFTDVNVTTSWARYSFTTTIPSTARTIQFSISSNGANMANASAINVAGAQVEMGSYTTPYRRSSGDAQSEQNTCYKYYQRYTVGGPYGNVAVGTAISATNALFILYLWAPMRLATPVFSVSGTSHWAAHRPGATIAAATALTLASADSTSRTVALSMTYSSNGSYGSYQSVLLSGANVGTAWMDFSAEL